MKKFTKILAVVLAIALTATLSVSLTLAYLTDQDEAVNVMTLGNVDIAQNEYERVKNADGTYETKEIDGVTSYVLKDFTQAKPLYPATEVNADGTPNNHGAGGWDSTLVDFSQIGTTGSANVFVNENAQDKIVTVKNTGKSDAYVRTWIALEDPFTENRIGVNVGNSSYYKQDPKWASVEIDGVKYSVSCFTYNEALKPGEVSHPSLIQVYLNSKATNEDMELLGDTYDILAFSQAVQVEGFADAKTALNVAFGTEHPWANGVPALGWDGVVNTSWYDASKTEYIITSAEDLAGFAEMVNGGNTFSGKTVKLAANINLGNKAWTPIGQNGDKAGFQGVFDGQGHTISGLNVNQSERAYQAAGLFGSARYATIKNFKVVNATVKNVDSASNSSNGAAVVVGAAQFATTIDNVDVENATIIGNRRVSAIAGYYVGTITNCDVKNVELVATFDDLGNGSYDNCDKVGGIIAYSNGASTITNNTVTNATISGYRDIGGIAGYATSSTLTGNTVSDLKINILTEHNYKNYANEDAHDAEAIVGEGTADATNAATSVTIKYPKVINFTSGSLYDTIAGMKAGDTIVIAAGTYNTSGTFQVPAGVTIIGAEGANVVIHQTSSAQDNIFACAGDVTIRNITFESNRKGYAIADNTKNHDTDGNITIENCNFKGIATEKNWGVYKNLNGNLTIKNCTFENYNNALCGINNGNGSKTIVTGCTFTNCNEEAIGYVAASMPADFEAQAIANNTGLNADNVIGY